MGKTKNLSKRHRSNKRARRRALRERYLAVQSGRLEVENKVLELKKLTDLLERRGWEAPASEDAS
jgi:hypothetical protein